MTATARSEAAIIERARHENFSVASLLLGSRTRRHLRAIYGFARLVDELGDSAPGDRLLLLDLLEKDLDRAFAGTPREPLLQFLMPTIRGLGLPRRPFLRLIEANRMDQRVSRYATFDELRAYCDLSANPVGELVLHVFGVATPETIALSDPICTALQLVEHSQDVGEDYRNGRIYLPAEDLARFAVDESQLAESHVSPELAALLAFEAERAARLLAEGEPLVERLHGSARLAVAGYVGGGYAAIAALERSGFDVLPHAPRAGRVRRLAQTLRAWR
jgi:squalene synthase HpnC